MKKGFTLIELLAVILILGIIALIAIPTVNNIIAESRYGAFKSGNENIMKTIQQNCQTDLIKGDNPIFSYVFTNGKSNNKIDVKGNLPNEGYILLNKDCNVTDYYLSDSKNIYSNGEDLREDYMLKSNEEEHNSIFITLYPSYFDKIISIEFINNLNIPNNAIEIKDPSESENGKIKSWLIEDGEFYKFYIGSDNTIYANQDSSYLFQNFSLVESILLNNFDTRFVENMASMFKGCLVLKDLNIENLDVSNVTNMSSLFYNCFEINSLNLNNWNTKNLKNMQAMFYYCVSLKKLEISNFNTTNLESLVATFNNCQELETLDLSSWDTSNLIGLSYAFENCYKLKKLNISTWNTPMLYHMESFIVRCNSLEILNLEKLNTKNVSKMNLFIFECPNLKEVYIQNFDFESIEEMNGFIRSSNSIEKIVVSNSDVTNIIDDFLPDRSENTQGIIHILNDKSNLDTSILESKNWTVL